MFQNLAMNTPADAAPTVRSARPKQKDRAVLFLLAFCLLALSGCSQEGKYKQLPVFYDFIENFPLAEVQQEPTLVDIGSPPARQHLLTGWYLNATH